MTDDEKGAEILEDEAGTEPERAARLVQALRDAYAKEGLGILLGTWPVSGGVVDQRVARLDALIGGLDEDEPPPTPYELGAMFRITPSQARSLLNTYQARYASKIRDRMKAKVATAEVSVSGDSYAFQFTDKATFDFAADLLRRKGFARGLETDSVKLTLKVPTKTKTSKDEDARKVLKG